MNISVDKISVIVPVYKVEEYLDECVDSILRQSYTNFELILVDDGSPDRCGEMCNEYQKKDSRIQVVHKKNGGLSDARNAGLKIASGEYLTFIDSDDIVSDDYLEVLFDAAKSFKADIVQGEFVEDKKDLKKCSNHKVTVYSKEEALRSLLRHKEIKVNAWGKLYCRECFEKVEYPVGRINEDNLTTYKNIYKAKRVVAINERIYYYRKNDSGIMRSSFAKRRFDILSFQNEIETYLGEDSTFFRKEIDYAEMRIAVRVLNDCIIAGKESEFSKEMGRVRNILRSYHPDRAVCELKYLLIVFMVKNNYCLYKNLVKSWR